MTRPKVALPIGDPAGIGPEIVLKMLQDPAINRDVDPVVIGDGDVLRLHADRAGVAVAIDATTMRFGDGPEVRLIDFAHPGSKTWPIGEVSPACGQACLNYARRAIELARAKDVAAVVAAPHTEASVNQAGYAFAGYPALVADEMGVPRDENFLLLLSEKLRIVNTTLHVSVRQALSLLSPELVLKAITATHDFLVRTGAPDASIGVGGVNPHAGEGGLFGSEDEEIVAPAIQRARKMGLNVEGPLPADSMFATDRHEIYVVMLHDQGHIPFKCATPFGGSAIGIGTGILFGSVAHGSAHDIAGQGVAKPDAMIAATKNIARLLAQQT